MEFESNCIADKYAPYQKDAKLRGNRIPSKLVKGKDHPPERANAQKYNRPPEHAIKKGPAMVRGIDQA